MKTNNHDKTLKIPAVVHRKLKEISATKGMPIYAILAQMLIHQMEAPLNDQCVICGQSRK